MEAEWLGSPSKRRIEELSRPCYEKLARTARDSGPVDQGPNVIAKGG